MNDMITQVEMDALLLQLIEQLAPERPTDEEAHAVVRWAERVRLGGHMLDMVLVGDAQVLIGADGQPSYRLTAKGMASAEKLIASSRDAANLQAELIAKLRGQTAVPEPKDQQ